MPSRQLDFPVYDADNHMYETTDSFTRHLPREYDGLVKYVQVNGRTKIALRNVISDYIPNPTFEVVAAPGAQEEYFKEGNKEGKSHREILGKPMKAIPASALQEWAELSAPRTFGMAVRVYSGLRLAEKHPVVHNLVISNVPGPPVPIYFMGGRVEALYPLGPVFHGAGLNITVISSNGRVHVGIIACEDQVPKPWDLAANFKQEMVALTNAAG